MLVALLALTFMASAAYAEFNEYISAVSIFEVAQADIPAYVRVSVRKGGIAAYSWDSYHVAWCRADIKESTENTWTACSSAKMRVTFRVPSRKEVKSRNMKVEVKAEGRQQIIDETLKAADFDVDYGSLNIKQYRWESRDEAEGRFFKMKDE